MSFFPRFRQIKSKIPYRNKNNQTSKYLLNYILVNYQNNEMYGCNSHQTTLSLGTESPSSLRLT